MRRNFFFFFARQSRRQNMAAASAASAGSLSPSSASGAAACAISLAACEAALAAHFASALAEPAPRVHIFGFGSLLFKREGDFATQHAALGGYVRRFYQASPDHRGTPSRLGRVCTLVPVARAARHCGAHFPCPLTRAAVQEWLSREPCAGAGAGAGGAVEEEAMEGEDPVVHGMVYCLEGADAAAHVARLCRREAGGYVARRVRCVLGSGEVVTAHTFVGEPSGQFYQPGTPAELARIIASARGASGENVEYLVLVRDALQQLGVTDKALEALVELTLAQKQ